jgi:hypothetical protein
MDIKILILDGKRLKTGYSSQPIEIIHRGETALEQTIFTLVERYFSPKQAEDTKMLIRETKIKLEEILKLRNNGGF